jgi:putative endonuclease
LRKFLASSRLCAKNLCVLCVLCVIQHPARRPVLDTGLGFPCNLTFGKTRLVYAERHDEIEPAIAREKLVKKWRREWKFALVEAENPDWLDLWDQWYPAVEARDGEVER